MKEVMELLVYPMGKLVGSYWTVNKSRAERFNVMVRKVALIVHRVFVVYHLNDISKYLK